MKENYKILINDEDFLKRVAIVSDKRVEYLFISRPDSFSGVGNIYKGRIEKIISGINAAFVNIGGPKNGFLPLEKDEILHIGGEAGDTVGEKTAAKHFKGEEVFVQISKPMTEDKGMKLTAQISLPGRFVIMLPGSSLKTISKKITASAERDRLLNIASKKVGNADMGFILRTAAEGQNERYIAREMKMLLGAWSKIKRYAKVKKTPSNLWSDLPVYTRIIRDFSNNQYNEVIVDDLKVFKEVKRYVNLFLPELKGNVKLYEGNTPLFMKYGIEKDIENSLSRKVYLPSGGYLLVEEGETLSAIDVNTGSSDKNNFRATVLNTNIEAAREIPRQIRVRNLSGLIIVDFIDMRHQRQRKKVFDEFNQNLEIDKAQINILSISKLGLVEMSREKTEFRLSEVFTDRCACCKGEGFIKNVYLDALKLKNAVALYLVKDSKRKLNVDVSGQLYEFVKDTKYIRELVKNRRIYLRENEHLEGGTFRIY